MIKKYGFIALLIFSSFNHAFGADSSIVIIQRILEKDILKRANQALLEKPVTITSAHSKRSAGGVHDFFSEGDYWWPNPVDTNGAYFQKDGMTNPDNFTQHRTAMIRFSQIIGTLASAFIITKDEKYVAQAFTHLKAWFIDEATLMNPSLLYSQAIKGKATGRGIGIIDMIQMMEVAQGIRIMEHAEVVDKKDLQEIRDWFSAYLRWVTTHSYGIAERDAKNNHGTCWVTQVAVFAKLTGNDSLIEDCRFRYQTILLPGQMDKDGSFPLELKRTKPYGYSLFNLDAMATICQVLSSETDNLWDYKTKDGSTLKSAIEFMYPFVKNKTLWPFQPDVMFWANWPVAQPFLVFGYQKYKCKSWLDTWQSLEHFPQTAEVIRNLPVRNPLIWME